MSKLDLTFLDSRGTGKEQFTYCKCESCGWEGNPNECETIKESEGWEYPEYEVDLCPNCVDGGCITDYAKPNGE